MAAFGNAEGAENIWVAASDGDLARVSELVESGGASVNAQDENGYSPIHAAVSYGQHQLLVYLLSKGADVHLKDADGDTPLLVCDDPECFEELVKHGADLSATNSEGNGLVDRVLEFFEEENDAMISHLKAKGMVPENIEAIVTKEAEEQVMGGGDVIAENTE
jgi:hypothetical protein